MHIFLLINERTHWDKLLMYFRKVFISRVISIEFFLKGMLRFCAFELHFKFLKEKLLIFLKDINIL